jgi:hypothetical protein
MKKEHKHNIWNLHANYVTLWGMDAPGKDPAQLKIWKVNYKKGCNYVLRTIF